MPLEEDEQDKYFKGPLNRSIRYYYYLLNGLEIINQFRNLFLAVIGLYIALEWTDPWLMVGMFVPSVIILTVAGYYNVHKVSKIKEWIALRFSSHFGIKNYDYTKQTAELLTEIRDLLKKDKPPE